ncbi:pectinesterase inhibitor-like [Impatiens glandulifera]|uniref:pectinesterase inhibitor-like n=1 Tax=Impatiens glandulifera TaxID=253017 RepID=UPI001FB18D22|nr:pectinesterase inhibitor-like [Impatiens glandulifera]
MAIHQTIGFLFLLAITPLTISIQYNYHASSSSPLLTSTCKKTEYQDLCLQVLSSDPHSATADLTALGRISTEKAEENSKSILDYSFKAVNEAKDYPHWSYISVCYHLYNDSYYPLAEKGPLAFKRGDYKVVEGLVDQMRKSGSKCLSVPTELKEMNDRSNFLVKITTVTINILNLL